MSDKDDCVEMSEEITAADGEDPSVTLLECSNDVLKQKDSENTDTNLVDGQEPQREMGQLKTKVEKLRRLKKEDPSKDRTSDIEIAEPDGEFMCGVVEGFYGRPWTTGQRKELFRRMKIMGLNTYLYGPKDDYKHRLYWRDLYSKDEAELLRLLMESAAEYDVLFVYAISPGLDMTFASPTELECLRSKLLQVQSLGCKAFALLFDDIDPLLCAADKVQYSSAASAQASVTNQMYFALDKPSFLFCPTEYCNSMAIPDVPNSKYLETIGKELDKHISVMWTGPKVVSKFITVESIKQLTQILRRKVVIWDNIHANDYDPKRMFLGPYKGRSTHLIPHLSGVLTNPNCELESNYIAMHTLACWWKSYQNPKQMIGKDQMTVDERGQMEENVNKRPRSQSVTMHEETANEDMVLETNQSDCTQGRIKQAKYQDSDHPNVEIDQGCNVSALGKKLESKGDSQPTDLSTTPQPSLPDTRQDGQDKSSMSSGVSSLAISDESDTDSDYSSHDGYYPFSRHHQSPVFDHGLYDPDKALKEAVKSWLPYFAAASVPLGKPIARSGPPLVMMSQSDITFMSNAAMGSKSSTTTVLREDPIVSASIVQGSGCDLKCNIAEVQETSGRGDMDGDSKCVESAKMEENDVDMSGFSSVGQTTETKAEAELQFLKIPSNCDSDMASSMQPRDEPTDGNQGSNVPSVIIKDESSLQMETEEAMQCENDPETVSPMSTTESVEESKPSEKTVPDTLAGEQVGAYALPRKGNDTEKYQDSFKAAKTSTDISNASMTLEDVQLAVELFYLPYEHGKFGLKMVREFVWLRSNIKHAVVPPNAPTSTKTESMDKAVRWMERAIQFEDNCSSIRKVCNKLLRCSNRALLYDLFPYFWDMKGVVSMLSSYVKWMGQFYLRHQPAIPLNQPETALASSKTSHPTALSLISVAATGVPPMPPAAVWISTDPEPWIFRGGMSGEFQRLLPLPLVTDLFCQAIPCSPPTSSDFYTIRPYLSADEKAVYNICLTTGNDGTDFADDFSGFEDLPGERLVGGLLTLSPEYCFIVEDEHGICGYLVGTADAKSFWRKYEVAFLPDIKEKYKKKDDPSEEKLGEDVKRLLTELRSDEPPDSYAVDNLYTSHPAFMQIAVHRRVTDPTIASSMTVCMLAALKSHNIHGVHTTVRSSDCFMPDQFYRLGFKEIRPTGISPSSSPHSSISTLSKEDSIIVYGRNF